MAMAGDRQARERRTLVMAVLLSAVIGGLVASLAVAWVRQHREAGEADRARADAEAQGERARQAANRAVRAREQAEELAGFILDDLRDELIPIGRAGVLAAAAERTVAYFEGLPPDLVTPETEVQRASVLMTLGLARHDLGDFDGASVATGAAAGILGDLLEADPGDRRLNEEFGRALNERGIVLNAAERFAEAREANIRARAHFDRLHEEEPDDPAWDAGAAAALFGLGESERLTGNTEGAVAFYEQAIRRGARALDRQPDNLVWLQTLMTCHNNAGFCHMTDGDVDSAERAYLASLAPARELVRLEPANRNWEKELATLVNNLGTLYDEREDWERAREFLTEAQRLREGLVSWDPNNARWLADLANSWHNLSSLEYDVGDYPAGLAAAREGAELHRRLVAIEPENSAWVEELRDFLRAQRDRLVDTPHAEDALAMTEEALAFVRKVAGEGAVAPHLDRLVAGLQNDVGRIHRDAGLDPEVAVEARREAVAVRARAFDAAPDDPETRYQMAAAFLDLAVVCRNHGRDDAALTAARLAQWVFRDFVPAGYKQRASYLDEAERLHVELAVASGDIDPPPVALVPAGAVWRFFDRREPPADGWTETAFDDGEWESGPAQLGFGDGDEATLVGFGDDPDNKHLTTWFRRRFDLPEDPGFGVLRFSLLRDDGAVVYVNGREVLRDGMPPGPVSPTTTAGVTTQDHDEDIYRIHVLDAESVPLRAGANVVAVEVHQNEAVSSDLSFDLELLADFRCPDPRLALDPGSCRVHLGDAVPDALLAELGAGAVE